MKNRVLDFKYALIQGLFFIVICIVLGYAAVYLGAIGMSSTMIGMVLATGNIVATVAQPILGAYIDKSHADVNHVLTVALMTVIALAVVLAITSGITVLAAILFIVLFGILMSLMPLFNYMAFAFENRGISINYGVARGVGSAAYALTSLALGRILSVVSPKLLPFFYAAVLLGLIPIIRSFKPKDIEEDIADDNPFEEDPIEGEVVDPEEITREVMMPEESTEVMTIDQPEEEVEEPVEKQSTFAFIRKYSRFFLFLMGFVLVYMDHQIINSFFINVVKAVGGDTKSMGNAVFLAAILELPVMFMFDFIKEKINIATLIKISAIMFSIKHVLTWIAPNMTIIYVAQVIQMFAYALYIPASVYYVNKLFDQRDAVKGQSLATVSMTVAGILATAIGGIMLDGMGVKMTLLLGAIVSIAGTAIMMVTTDNV